MWSFAHIRPAYSRAERISDGLVHVFGVALALIAVPVLIAMTMFNNAEPLAIVGASVYGVSLIIMLTFSALYNMNQCEAWTGFLRRLDHSGIYFKIAGTYTPFILVSGAPPTALLVGLWSSATLGSVLKMTNPDRFRWVGLALYLIMGWAIVLAGHSLMSEFSPAVLTLIISGGVIYTLGVVFFLLEWLPFHNTIWHVFVLAASILFFTAVSLHVPFTSSVVQ